MSNGVAATEPREAVVYLPLNTRVQSLPPRRRSVSFLSEAVETLAPTFYREYLAGCLNDIPFPLLWGLPSPALLFPHTKEYVPCSPLPYLDIGTLFYTGGKKQNKEIRSFFFLFNVSSFDWLCHLGIWKKHLADRFSLGYRAYIVSRAPQLVREDKAGICCFELEFKWLLFLYSLTFLQNGPVITRKMSWWFSLWLCPWFPLGARPGCIVVRHVEGRRGETARNDSDPHTVSYTPRSFPYPLGERRGFSVFLGVLSRQRAWLFSHR